MPPQLLLNNPTSSVQREVVPPGPQFLLPLVANARIGPLRVDGEVGYWFTNHQVPQYWIRGLIIGRDFTERTQAYLEIYNQQNANRIDGAAKQRETTWGVGGRQALNSRNNILLLLNGWHELSESIQWQRSTQLDCLCRCAVPPRTEAVNHPSQSEMS